MFPYEFEIPKESMVQTNNLRQVNLTKAFLPHKISPSRQKALMCDCANCQWLAVLSYYASQTKSNILIDFVYSTF